MIVLLYGHQTKTFMNFMVTLMLIYSVLVKCFPLDTRWNQSKSWLSKNIGKALTNLASSHSLKSA